MPNSPVKCSTSGAKKSEAVCLSLLPNGPRSRVPLNTMRSPSTLSALTVLHAFPALIMWRGCVVRPEGVCSRSTHFAGCRGCDALPCAAEGGHAEVFECLLEAGCDPAGRDHLNATLLHYAATGGSWRIVQRLLNLGCDRGAVTKYGRTVLHYAAYSASWILCNLRTGQWF